MEITIRLLLRSLREYLCVANGWGGEVSWWATDKIGNRIVDAGSMVAVDCKCGSVEEVGINANKQLTFFGFGRDFVCPVLGRRVVSAGQQFGERRDASWESDVERLVEAWFFHKGYDCRELDEYHNKFYNVNVQLVCCQGSASFW